MVRLADVTGLDHQGSLGAVCAPQQVMVHGADQQQGRNRGPLSVRVAVGQHNVLHATVDRARHLLADLGEPGAQRAFATLGAVQATDLHGHLVAAGRFDVGNLGQLVVVDDRERQGNLRLADLFGIQQVAVGTNGTGQRGNQLFADGIQRRVGNLREGLHKVVKEQPGTLGEHSHGCVGSHGAQRFGAGAGHRTKQDPKLLGGVPERPLADVDGGGSVDHVLAFGEVLEVNQVVLDPLGPRVRGSDLGLDLFVVDDAAGIGVHQEHLARRNPALLDHLGGFDVDHPHLGGEDDQPVFGDPVASGAQTVAVQGGADKVAVGEGDGGGAVPRLHEQGVVFVERTPCRIHGGVVFPGLGDHHHDRVRDGAAGEPEQLGDFVEGRGVGRTRGADGVQLFRGVTQQRVGELGLARAHPVPVALNSVDFTVVGDGAERLGQRPRREGVGGEARVDDSQLGFETLVREVGVERLQLGRREHALVDDGPGGQRREVYAELVLGTLADPPGA